MPLKGYGEKINSHSMPQVP